MCNISYINVSFLQKFAIFVLVTPIFILFSTSDLFANQPRPNNSYADADGTSWKCTNISNSGAFQCHTVYNNHEMLCNYVYRNSHFRTKGCNVVNLQTSAKTFHQRSGVHAYRPEQTTTPYRRIGQIPQPIRERRPESDNANPVHVYVPAKIRRDGRYVRAHYKTKANGVCYDNFRYNGNYNPYRYRIGRNKC
jgi:hypothetical protein